VNGNVDDTYKALCVKECPTNAPSLTEGVSIESLEQIDCLLNSDYSSCPYKQYNTNQLLGFCLPEISSTIEQLSAVAEQMGQTDNLTTLIVSASKTWTLMIYMAIGVFFITLLYVFVLQWIAKPLLYISTVFLLFLLAGLGVFVWLKQGDYEAGTQEQQGMMGGAIALWVLAVLYLVFLCCNWRNIQMAAAITQASSDFLSSNTRIISLPIMTYILMIPVTGMWLFSTTHLMSIGTPVYVPNSYVGSMEYENYIIYLFLFMLFGFFWIIAFMGAY